MIIKNPVPSEDSLSMQDVLEALDDDDCRAILCEMSEAMTANELIAVCDIPRSTVYRKLELLSEASLVREQNMVNPKGGRITRYERSFADISISMNEDDEFSVTVERTPPQRDERLVDFWSAMVD